MYLRDCLHGHGSIPPGWEDHRIANFVIQEPRNTWVGNKIAPNERDTVESWKHGSKKIMIGIFSISDLLAGTTLRDKFAAEGPWIGTQIG